MVQVAFYKGKGLIGNALIRWWTNSPYSHCEVVVDNKGYSSSLLDHGVRCKAINWVPEHWDFIEVPWVSPREVLAFYESTKWQSYSWLDLLRAQLFNHGDDEIRKSFCSEWVAQALGLPCPTQYSPKSLKRILEFISTKVYAV